MPTIVSSGLDGLFLVTQGYGLPPSHSGGLVTSLGGFTAAIAATFGTQVSGTVSASLGGFTFVSSLADEPRSGSISASLGSYAVAMAVIAPAPGVTSHPGASLTGLSRFVRADAHVAVVVQGDVNIGYFAGGEIK